MARSGSTWIPSTSAWHGGARAPAPQRRRMDREARAGTRGRHPGAPRVRVPGRRSVVGAPTAQGLVQAFARTSPLTPVAEFGTLRRPVALVGAGGEELRGAHRRRRHRPQRWRDRRTVPRDRGGVRRGGASRVGRRGRGSAARGGGRWCAGAPEAPPCPRVRRAAGPRDRDPQLGPRPTAGDVVHRAIATSVERLIRHDLLVRLDTDSGRRPPGPRGHAASAVGSADVRDARGRVLGRARPRGPRVAGRHARRRPRHRRDARRIRRFAAELPPADDPVVPWSWPRWNRPTRRSIERLLEAMRTDRYAALLEALVAAANQPPLLPEAAEPARERPSRSRARSLETPAEGRPRGREDAARRRAAPAPDPGRSGCATRPKPWRPRWGSRRAVRGGRRGAPGGARGPPGCRGGRGVAARLGGRAAVGRRRVRGRRDRRARTRRRPRRAARTGAERGSTSTPTDLRSWM